MSRGNNRNSDNGGKDAASLEDILRELGSKDAGGRKRSIVRGIARLLAYNGVITRGTLGELSRGSSAGRQMVSFLKKSGLLYETRSGYILSVPWLVYFFKSYGDTWVERVRRLAPYIREDELKELDKLVTEASKSPLGRFVEAYVSSLEGLQELVAIPSGYLPVYCTKELEQCFQELLHYSRWLLLLITGIFEFYSKGARYGEVIGQLDYMAKGFIEFFSRDFEEEVEEGSLQLSYFKTLVTETATALKRHATRLYELHRGRGARVLEEAIEWALKKYREANGRNDGRARYYVRLLLRETAKAVMADVSTRIALF